MTEPRAQTPVQLAIKAFLTALSFARTDERTHETFLSIASIRIAAEYAQRLDSEGARR